MRIVRLANLVTPTSGGIRTTLEALRAVDVGAGREVVEIVPGAHHDEQHLPGGGVRRTLPGRPLPGGAGYRVLTDGAAVRAALSAARPDRIEVHDRFTLAWVAAWARRRGIPATVVVHERLLGALRTWARLGPLTVPAPALRIAARALDAGLVVTGGRTVVASRYAAAAFAHVPTAAVAVVPLGVDLDRFAPAPTTPLRGRPLQLVSVGRLSREKRTDLAVGTLAALHRSGARVQLHVVGDGPERVRLVRAARDLPVVWHGHLPAAEVAERVRDADVALATCPVETFGLAALEALATGTPLVVPPAGALPELLTSAPPGAGQVADEVSVAALADAVTRVLGHDHDVRSRAARATAERFSWRRTADALHADAPDADAPNAGVGTVRRLPSRPGAGAAVGPVIR